MSRPCEFKQEIADHICSEIASGRSLRAICREDKGMPAQSTIYLWLARMDAFSEQYARAMELRTNALADDILEIADGENEEDVQRARLRVDARKWLMSKLAPKKYGDRIMNEHSGSIGVRHEDAIGELE